MTEPADLEQGQRVYVDSNIFIYLFEDISGFAERAATHFTKVAEMGGVLVTSELTIAECCYKPASDGNKKLISAYEDFFENSGEVDLVSLTGEVVKRAALVGAQLGLKLLDAIHYVSAQDVGCVVLLTADRKFRSGSDIQVLHI